MKIKTYVLAMLLILFSLSACNNSARGKKFASNTTGWVYNDPQYGGFQTNDNYEQNTPPGMVFIEGGSFTMGRMIEDVPGDWNNLQRRVSVNSFYMDQYEVSNRDWKEYLHWLSLVYNKFPQVYKDALPDTTVWKRALAYNDPITDYYFRHAAYNNYPVVGVTWEQVQDYCLWRTDRVNEKILSDAGRIELPDYSMLRDSLEAFNSAFNTAKYLLRPDYQPQVGSKPLTDAYGNQRKTNFNDGYLLPNYRLPTEAEWEYAAYGLKGLPGESNYFSRRIYPWDGRSLRSEEKKEEGEILANFALGRGDYMGVAGNLNDGAMITAPVNSFKPNDWGLFNMAGNVNEWVQDVYRATSHELVDEINPFRGNLFKRPKDTTIVIDGKETVVVMVDEKGKVIYEEIPDSLMKKGYPTADLRNWQDGDSRTSMNPADWKSKINPETSTNTLYAPDGTTEEGMLSTHISNTVRVYKGGGWRDRPYWLNPSTRRYLEEKRSRDDLGFRCAMDRVGPTQAN